MNTDRFKKMMQAVEPELLEEAKQPVRRSPGKGVRSFVAAAACFAVLAGGAMMLRPQTPAQSEPAPGPEGNMAMVVNPMQSASAAELEQLGYQMPLPDGAQNTSYKLINTGRAVPMAQVSFQLAEEQYTCRAVKTEQAEDISGIYQQWTQSVDWVVDALELQLRRAADSAWVGWFSAEDGVQWCLSGSPDGVMHTASEIVQTLGYQMAVAPDGAGEITYDVLALGGLDVGETSFVLDGVKCTYRIASTAEIREDFADISGVEDFSLSEQGNVAHCAARLSYEENGPGKILWFDIVPGLLYSLSVDTGASVDALTRLADSLFTPAQGSVG